MLRWCAYCQQFLGETDPYDSFKVSHGMCVHCHPKGLDLSEADSDRMRSLSLLQQKLWTLGQAGDADAAVQAIHAAVLRGPRHVDLFMGLIVPLLYEIGELWQAGKITVDHEHRFTAFAEKVFAGISSTIKPAEQPRVLLVNAFGNSHVIAIQTHELYLLEQGISAKALDPNLPAEQVMALIEKYRPQHLLISASLSEQRAGIIGLAEKVQTLPAHLRPKLSLGGYSVKMQLMPPIPEIEMVPDISLLKL